MGNRRRASARSAARLGAIRRFTVEAGNAAQSPVTNASTVAMATVRNAIGIDDCYGVLRDEMRPFHRRPRLRASPRRPPETRATAISSSAGLGVGGLLHLAEHLVEVEAGGLLSLR